MGQADKEITGENKEKIKKFLQGIDEQNRRR